MKQGGILVLLLLCFYATATDWHVDTVEHQTYWNQYSTKVSRACVGNPEFMDILREKLSHLPGNAQFQCSLTTGFVFEDGWFGCECLIFYFD